MLKNIIEYAKTLKRIDPIKKHPDFQLLIDKTDFLSEKVMLRQRIWHVEHNIYEIPLCKHCGKVEVNWRKTEYSRFCSMKCLSNDESTQTKRKNTLINIYGVDNAMKSPEVREKAKQSNLKKYGVEYAVVVPEIVKQRGETNLKKYGNVCSLHGEEIVEKVKQTNLKKRGVEYASQSKEFKEKVKQTNLKKHGVEHIFQLNSTRESLIKSNQKRFGVDYASQSPVIKEKVKQTNQENFGVDYASQSPMIKEKVKQTNQKIFGVDYVLQSPIIKEKMKQTNLDRYGFENTFQVEKFKEKAKQTMLNNHGVEYFAQKDFLLKTLKKLNNKEWLIYQHHILKKTLQRIGFELYVTDVTIANYLSKHNVEVRYYFQSQPERDITVFIKEHSKYEILNNKRNIIYKEEIDIYLPEIKLAIEFNGNFFHSELKGKDKNYHLNKFLKCKELGIDLMHIWEHDWVNSKNIVLSLILDKINKVPNKIDTRQCTIEEISKNTANNFLLENHLNGYVNLSINLGLFKNNNLVSVMSFTLNNEQYNMVRFASELYTNVCGAYNKLFKYFVKNYNPKSVISYVQRGLFTSSVHKRLGFVFLYKNDPNCYYFHKSNTLKLFSQIKFQKHKLAKELDIFDPKLSAWENMKNNGYDRIWDCGNNVYIFKNNG